MINREITPLITRYKKEKIYYKIKCSVVTIQWSVEIFKNLPSPLFAKEGNTPLNPLLVDGNLSSLWKREVRRDFSNKQSLPFTGGLRSVEARKGDAI
ncbi:MAG: hypothetical protein HY754_15315 [Nitrospirae bacterium]|nr:hypothetical protein [Nitrospirota bacterium]